MPSLPRRRQGLPGWALPRGAADLGGDHPCPGRAYDYGTVVVRVALHIDPLDAHVVADSETVPSIIGGIPLRMRSIQVNIDKPELHD